MKSESARYLGLLERRLELLAALLRAVGEWRRAFIGMELQIAEASVQEQAQLCATLGAIDAELALLQTKHLERAGLRLRGGEFAWPQTADTDPVVHNKIRAALQRMVELQRDLRLANHVSQAILAHSGRTLNALRNLFNSYAPTYAAPPAPGVGAVYEETV